MYKIHYLLFTFLLIVNIAWTQNNLSLTEQNEQIYSQLDYSAIPYGLLMDKGNTTLDLSFFDGDPNKDSIVVNENAVQLLYSSVQTASLGNNLPLPDLTELNENFSAISSSDPIPLVLIFQKMGQIKANAIEDNLLKVIDNKLALGSNQTASPYQNANLFFHYSAVSEIKSLNPTFTLSDSFLFSNAGNWDDLEIDFGDGLGYRSVEMDASIRLQYGEFGKKIIKVKFTTENNETLISQSEFVLLEEESYSSRWDINSDETLTELDYPELEGMRLSIWYNERCSTELRGIRKPLIFIEGFDHNNCTGPNQFFDPLDKKYTLPGGDKLLRDELEDGGYDLVFIDFNKTILEGSNEPGSGGVILTAEAVVNTGADDIRDNADRVINAIKWINDQKAKANSVEQNVVIGASMGGIIGKLAHLKMESVNYPHQSKNFISFDSPLLGANIPLGFQAMIKRLALTDLFGIELRDIVEPLKNGYASVSSPAARNQLFYHIDGYDEGDATLYHQDFYSEFDQYPELEVEHIAISNSAEDGTGMLYSNGTLVLDMEGSDLLDKWWKQGLSTLWQVLGGDKIKLDQNIWASPGNNEGFVYQGSLKYQKRLIAIIPIYTTILTIQQDEVSFNNNWMSLDASVGGMRPYNQLESCRSANDDGEDKFELPFLYNAFCFVPQFSAYDADPQGENNAVTHANINTDFLWRKTGGELLFPDEPEQKNEKHVYFSDRNVQFMAFSFLESGTDDFTTGNIEGNVFNFGQGEALDWDKVNHTEGVIRRSTSKVIDKSITVGGSSEIWINRDEKIGFIEGEYNPLSENGDFFKVDLIRGCDEEEPTVLDIRDGGQVIVGENPGDDKGHLVVNDMTSIQVSRNGLLRVNRGSKLIIKSGGYVKVEEKGKLQANGEGKVIVETGGILEIMSAASLKADWYAQIIIQDGGKLILHGDAIADVSNSGKIDIKGELVIKDNFTFQGNGRFRFFSSNKLTLENDWDFHGIDREITAIEVVGGSIKTGDKNIRLAQMTVESSGFAAFKAEDAPTFRVTNVSFKGNAGAVNALDFKGDIDVNFTLSTIENFQTGINLNENNLSSGCTLLFAEVNNCEYGLTAGDVSGISVVQSVFDGQENGEFGMILSRVKRVKTSGSEFSNFSLSGFLLEEVVGLFMHSTDVSNNGYGIWSPDWTGANVFLEGQTDIHDNDIGVYLQQGAAQTSTEPQYGVLLVDCAKIRDNDYGVQGNDITLQVDALVNCGNCPIAEIAPNHFENANANFDICLSDATMSTVLARGNYWGPDGPKGLDITNGADCSGTVTVNTAFAVDEATETCIFAGIIEPGPSTTIDDCKINSNGKIKNVYTEYGQAYAQFRQGNYDASLPHFKSVAGIQNQDRTAASPICKTYIDVARAITRSLDDEEAVIALTTFSDDLEPEQLVSNYSTSVYPNPAKDEVTIRYEFLEKSSGLERINSSSLTTGTINIYNSVGILIHQSILLDKQILNTRNWSNGLYLVRILDMNDNLISTEKLMITK